MGGGLSLILKLAGRPPPRKSSMGMALDELESRLEEKKR